MAKRHKAHPRFNPTIVRNPKIEGPRPKMSQILESIRQLLLSGLFPANLAALVVEAEGVLGTLSKVEKEREDAREEKDDGGKTESPETGKTDDCDPSVLSGEEQGGVEIPKTEPGQGL